MDSSQNAQRILEGLSSPVLLIDTSYEIVAANRAARDHMRQPSDEVVGQSCFRVTHGLDAPCWKAGGIDCPLHRALELGEPTRSIHKHKIDGRLVVEELIATPLRGENGQIEYVIEEFRDVTKLLELHDGLLSICAGCKKIRDLEGRWLPPEVYFRDHTGADFSHALCDACIEERHPELA